MIGVLVVLAALFALNRPPEDRALIEGTISTAATSADPSYCKTKVTPSYLEQVTAARQPFAASSSTAAAGGRSSPICGAD